MSDEKPTKKSKKSEAVETTQFPFDFLEAKDAAGAVDPKTLIFAPFDSRADSEAVKLDQSFVEDIKANGILQPVLVTPVHDKTTGKDGLMLIAGRQRTRAALELGLKTIPVHIRSMSLIDALVACGAENTKRRQLSFFDEASYMRLLTADHGMTATEVARKLGVSNAKVSQYLAVFKLDPRVQKLVKKGDFGAGVSTKIRPLGEIEDGEVQYQIAMLAIAKEWTSDDIAEAVARYHAKEEAKEEARREREKAKKAAKKAAASGDAEEAEEAEEEEAPASKFDIAKITPIKKEHIHALLDSVTAKIDKLRAAEEVDEGKLGYQRGMLDGLKLAGGLKDLPKSVTN